MSKLIIRTDNVLSVEREDIELLTSRGFEYAQIPCATEDELIDAAGDASGLLVLAEPITAKVIGALPKLEVVGRFGVGLDSVDVPAATEAGVRVVNVPDANTGEVAHHAMAMILSLVRRLPQLDASVKSGRWTFRDAGPAVRRVSELQVGVLGLGRIGRLVANHCKSLGFRVAAYDPHVTTEAIVQQSFDSWTFDQIVTEADIISVHIPLEPETRNLISADVIRGMKANAILVNVSRGGLIDEAALAAAIKSGALSGIGLDTVATEPLPADSPLRGLPSVIVTPHAAHYSEQAFRETVHRAFADVARVVGGEEPLNPVN
jgi:D-3-phosphoglycerate dehydrogenase